MSKKICIITSDNHLKPYTWARHPTLRWDSFHSFAQIIVRCREYRLPLILAGDILDERRPDSETVSSTYEILDLMKVAKLPVYYIQGQHEMANPPWLSLGDWNTHIHKRGLEIHGLRFYGLDYTPASDIHKELAMIPENTDILVAHQVWEEYMGRIRVSEAAFKDVPHAKSIITGDFHAHKLTKENNRQGDPIKVASPGSTSMQSIDESPDKYFFVLYDDMHYESVLLQTRPTFLSKIGTDEMLTQQIKAVKEAKLPLNLPDELQKPIWIVEYYDTVPDVVKRIQKAAGNDFHLFLRPIRPKKVEEEEQYIDPDLIGYGLRGALMKKYDPKSFIGGTAIRLLEAPDVKREILNITREVETADTRWENFQSDKPQEEPHEIKEAQAP